MIIYLHFISDKTACPDPYIYMDFNALKGSGKCYCYAIKEITSGDHSQAAAIANCVADGAVLAQPEPNNFYSFQILMFLLKVSSTQGNGNRSQLGAICIHHYSEVIMGPMAYQITSLAIVYSAF